jgi:hypothetical protein
MTEAGNAGETKKLRTFGAISYTAPDGTYCLNSG